MEKKGIRCSYAVLVIILFAALAFVVDYTVIDRKVNKCSCPDCKSSGNYNVSNGDGIITSEDGSTTTEQEKVYTFSDLVGYYTFEQTMDESSEYSNGKLAFRYLYLDDKGTFSYDSGIGSVSTGTLGNYIIKDNKLILNNLFSYTNGNETYKDNNELYITSGQYEFEILSDGSLKTNLGFTGIPTVTMIKQNSASTDISNKFYNRITTNKIIDYTSDLYDGEGQ